MSGVDTSLTVILPTFNRAETLRESLEHFAGLDAGGLEVEFVVVDNNSSDETPQVVESFRHRLALRYLFQGRPGKNAALNLALEEVEDLGELVVFTDDDVSPRNDWLQEIAACAARWPEFDVFGGATFVVWPVDDVPGWARSPEILGWGFSSNEDIGTGEHPYPEGRYPVGFNYWVRREALSSGIRFDEALGPVPENRILGDETAFQMALAKAGHRILYSGRVVVGHRVGREMVTARGIYTRAVTIARAGPILKGVSRLQLLERRPLLWYVLRLASMARYGGLYVLARFIPGRDTRVERTVAAIRGFVSNREMLRMAKHGTLSGRLSH